MRIFLTSLVFVFATSLVAQAQVSGEIRDGKIVVISSEPVQAAGLDFQSPAGNLVPVPDPPGSSPFTFFLSNTANQITWGNLGTSVTIDGELPTEAGYNGSPEGDLKTFWGNGPMPVEFSTVIPGGGTTDGGTTDGGTTDGGTTDGGTTDGSGGGPVSGEIRDGKIVVLASEPVQAAGLDFQSPAGNLVPVPDPPGSSPFTFFLSNTANQITWGNLGTSVTIDGELPTEAGYNGDPAGDLKTFWGNGPMPVEFSTVLAGGGTTDGGTTDGGTTDGGTTDGGTTDGGTTDGGTTDGGTTDGGTTDGGTTDGGTTDGGGDSGGVGGFVNASGFIVVTASSPVEAAGLDFQSAGGLLVPVPEATGAAPFTFFLSNTVNQITWGNLGTTVTIEGQLTTAAGYSGTQADLDAGDLTTFWGNGPEPVAFPTGEIVPEPASGMLAIFAVLGFLGFRKRRS